MEYTLPTCPIFRDQLKHRVPHNIKWTSFAPPGWTNFAPPLTPLIPPGKPGGGKRRVAIREVINGVMYILSTGCQWRALPKDLPPRSTVHDYLGLWNWDGTLDRIHHALYLKCREKAAREASPTACIIDSQSVKSAEKGGLASTATASMPAS